MLRLRSWFGAGPSKAPDEEVIEFDPLDPAFVTDPAPIYAKLRKAAPLARLVSGGFLMARASDIRAAFTDPLLGNTPSRFSALAPRNRDRYVAADVAAHIPPFLDKPEHVPARRALSQAFFRTFETARPWIEELARTTAGDARGTGRVDLVSQIARPFVITAMSRFIGLPNQPERVLEGSAAMLRLFAPIRDRADFDETNEALASARAFIRTAMASPVNGSLIGHLSDDDEFASALPTEQAIDCALLVLADGIENIEAAIAIAVLRLSGDPDVAARISDRRLAPKAAVAEALRLSTPAQIIPRVALADHSRHGIDISAGTPVFLALGSANLDPSVYDAPERFDPGREERSAYIFGQGRHRCIGEPLALTLVSEMVAALVATGVAPDIAAPEVRYVPRFGHRWPEALPVSFFGAV